MASTLEDRVLREIPRSELNSTPAADVHKKAFEAIASYTWQDKTTPTIFVPGSPAKWAPNSSGARLPQDAGLVIIDQNAYRNPRCPLEPLFRALFTLKPDFETDDIDLVTDRNNLRKLYRFVTNEDDGPFKIAVQRVGKTTLFTRIEDKTSEHITEFRGFSHEFRKAYTKWPIGMENSTTNHRIVRYEFGGIRCVVRFEADATTQDTGSSRDVDDVLSNLLGSISIDKKPKVCESSTFHVTRHGSIAPQASLLKIKTRAASRALNLADIMPQLWFSGTPTLIAAYHRGGRFNDIKITRMDNGELDTWERTNAANLRKLLAVLKIIIKEAGLVEGRRCVVQNRGDGKLTIRRIPGTEYHLPRDLKAKFH